MSDITVVGGVYAERCIWPQWEHMYGSAGRAAATLRSHVTNVRLCSYSKQAARDYFEQYVKLYGFTYEPVKAAQTISFDYVHSLSIPTIRPHLREIAQNEPIVVTAPAVLRFGMLEGSAVVSARRCVYDPQSAFDPQGFADNGSKAEQLAIVGNRGEISALSRIEDPLRGARYLIETGAEVVVVKSGPDGAFVVDSAGVLQIPAHRSERVWTIGTGDVFAAIFAARWAVHGESARESALLASRAVAEYVESMALPAPTVEVLRASSRPPALTVPGRVYLAGPFFTLGERWLVDEARHGLLELGLKVFSPVHDVGHGAADEVAPKDLSELSSCDRMFAIIDGLDSGTLFEVGYARAKGIPVYVLSQSVAAEDLKMISGSKCHVFDDFVTALHHTAWRA